MPKTIDWTSSGVTITEGKGIHIEGEKEFYAAIKGLINSTKPAKMEPILFRGVQIVSRASRKNAPVKTGTLKKAIKSKRLKRRFGQPAPAISAVDRKKAPHAHLVHDGTGERIGKQGYRPYRGKRFGRMPANPFHQKAWDENKGKVLGYVEKNVKKLVEGAGKRGY